MLILKGLGFVICILKYYVESLGQIDTKTCSLKKVLPFLMVRHWIETCSIVADYCSFLTLDQFGSTCWNDAVEDFILVKIRRNI